MLYDFLVTIVWVHLKYTDLLYSLEFTSSREADVLVVLVPSKARRSLGLRASEKKNSVNPVCLSTNSRKIPFMCTTSQTVHGDGTDKEYPR